MAADTEIQNKESICGNETNEDGSLVQEIVKDGDVVAEIRNNESIFGNETNEDGGPARRS